MCKKKKQNSFFRVVKTVFWTAFLALIVFGLIGAVIGFSKEQKQQELEEQAVAAQLAEEAALKETMQKFLYFRQDPATITGDKAIAAIYDDEGAVWATFRTDYVPEDYRTKDADEVRYIVKVVKGTQMVGVYSNGGGMALKYHFKVTVIDLKEDAILNSESFFGGDPPAAVTSEDGYRHVGPEPDAAVITEWVLTQIRQGVTGDSRNLWRTVHVKVPASWSQVFCEARDGDLGVFGETKQRSGQAYKKMEKDGDYYVVDVPTWADTFKFTTDPEQADAKTSEEDKVYYDEDVWLIVHEDGRVRTDLDAGKE